MDYNITLSLNQYKGNTSEINLLQVYGLVFIKYKLFHLQNGPWCDHITKRTH